MICPCQKKASGNMFLTHVGDPNTFTQFHCEILRNWFPSELFHRPRGFLSSRSSASFRELDRLRTWKAQRFTMFHLPNLGKGAQLMPTHLLPPLQHVEAATLSLAPGNRKMLPPQKNTPPPVSRKTQISMMWIGCILSTPRHLDSVWMYATKSPSWNVGNHFETHWVIRIFYCIYKVTI